MQTVARHDVGLAAQDTGCTLLHLHQFEEPELAFFMIKKQVNVGIVPGLATRGRAEQVELFDAEPLQIGLVLQQSVYGFISLHEINLADRRVLSHQVLLHRVLSGQEAKQTTSQHAPSLLHPVHKWMAATLDGLVDPGGAVFEAKFMLPWTFSEEGAAEKHMAQLQHNMWVANARSADLSIITGGGKWVEMSVHADPLYQHLLLTAEKRFWRCVMSGEEPRLFGVEPPRPRLEAVRIVDMSASNSWAEFAATFRRTRPAYQEHEGAKADLKKLVPEDAKEAIGQGLRAKRSKSGAISFDLMDVEVADAPLQ